MSPVLGICGGQQLINVVLGGTLIQHIPDMINTRIKHEQPNPRDKPSHFVHIKKNSLLFNFVKKSKIFLGDFIPRLSSKPEDISIFFVIL